MRTSSFQLVMLTVGSCLIGCAEAETFDPLPQAADTQSAGGSATVGSKASTGRGKATSSGTAQAGGQISAEGTATSGNRSLGGTASGSSNASQARPVGGAEAVGSATETGGASTTGNSEGTWGTTATGEPKAAGGTTTGRTRRATGGAATTGGAKAAGGASASGGSKATAGTAATGDTTGTVKKFCGNITTRGSVDTGGMNYSKYWDQITPENEGKWGSVQSSPTSNFNWKSLDAIYDYAQKNGIMFKQHTFVWGSQQPSGTPTLAQVENWIKSFCERYPNTKLIDVVNEPPPHTTPKYTANLGAGESGTWGWITKAFKLARQHCPGAILILNDYNNIEYADQENHFIDIVNQVKAAGGPIDAVGAQAHAIFSSSAATAQANIDKLASKTGLPVYITEFDVPKASDADQLAVYKALFPVFWNTSTVHGVTVWGWINGSTWISNTGLVNGTKPRSAMTWLMGTLDRPVPPN